MPAVVSFGAFGCQWNCVASPAHSLCRARERCLGTYTRTPFSGQWKKKKRVNYLWHIDNPHRSAFHTDFVSLFALSLARFALPFFHFAAHFLAALVGSPEQRWAFRARIQWVLLRSEKIKTPNEERKENEAHGRDIGERKKENCGAN